MQAGEPTETADEPTETADETEAVADYYKVLNNLLSVFDLEKLYFPPMLDESEGLYANQLLTEKAVLQELDLKDPTNFHLLDMGCGRRGSSTISRRRPVARYPVTTSIRINWRTPMSGPPSAA
jgi:cyclopropane fatty-acyl-phospholipid synthase-like methyltransferase